MDDASRVQKDSDEERQLAHFSRRVLGAEVGIKKLPLPGEVPPKQSYWPKGQLVIVALNVITAGRPAEMHHFAVNVQHRVLSVVRSVLEQNAIIAEVHPESRLVDIGLSSMGMVELMLKVEAEFDLILPQFEITPENFQSVKAMERMIINQLGSGAG
ncbi:acyl carrier protein [Bradyrhizobium sp. USDA 377]